MILKLAAAFLCGVTLFAIIVVVKNRKKVVERRKTTSLRMARIMASAATEAPAPVLPVLPAAADDFPQEFDSAQPAPAAPGDDNQSGDSQLGDDEQSAAGQPGDSQFACDEQADGGQSENSPALESPPAAAAPFAACEAGESDHGDETRETHAVSMADIMAACAEEEKEESGKRDSEPDPAETYKPLAANIEAVAPPPKKRRLPETVRMKERRVLLVDDRKVDRELVTTFFEGSGIKFDCAENGSEAFDKFAENPGKYSLILMDVQMPVMDGCEAACKIRALDIEWAKQIPILAITSNDQKNDIDRSFDAGMDDHITKPLDMDALQEKVFEYLPMGPE